MLEERVTDPVAVRDIALNKEKSIELLRLKKRQIMLLC